MVCGQNRQASCYPRAPYECAKRGAASNSLSQAKGNQKLQQVVVPLGSVSYGMGGSSRGIQYVFVHH
jgi:hypothetical protein